MKQYALDYRSGVAVMLRFGFTILFTFSASVSPAADWPQWLGPNRDSIWPETGIVDSFPASGLTKKWSVPVHGGYSGPAVAGGYVYISDYHRTHGDPKPNPAGKNSLKGKERIQCFKSATGEFVWKQEYDCPYEISYPIGPRCTPTVHEGLVYCVGSMGHLLVMDAKTGDLKWKKDFVKDYGATVPIWGFAGHPVIHNDTVIVMPGGTNALVVALDKKTGVEKWKSLNAKEPGYCTPAICECKKTNTCQLLIWHPSALVGLNPENGDKIWEYELKPLYGMSIMSPRLAGDTVFAGGIGVASLTVKYSEDSGKPHELWRGDRQSSVYPVNMTPFIEDGIIYGVCQPGALRAVDLKTSKRLWASMLPVTGKDTAEIQVSSGTAYIIKNGDRFFLFSETGHLIIAKMDAKGYNEVSRTKIIEPTSEAFGRKVAWSHPAFAEKCIFVRNDNELLCYYLAKE